MIKDGLVDIDDISVLKEAEKCASKLCCTDCKAVICEEKCECWNFAKKGFLAGLKIGRDTKWHNLKKDPSDLPEPYTTVLDEEGNKTTYQGGGKWTFYSDYYEMDIDAISPIAWCEIPKFEE